MRIGWVLVPVSGLLVACGGGGNEQTEQASTSPIASLQTEVSADSMPLDITTATAPDPCVDEYRTVATAYEAFWATYGFGATDFGELVQEGLLIEGLPNWELDGEFGNEVVGSASGPCPGYNGPVES
jgi:hypothetical protein